MQVQETLAVAGVAFNVHHHPPIRSEADLHRTNLDQTTSVKTLAFELPDGRLALVGVPGPFRVRYGAIAQALGVSRSQLRPATEERLRAVGMEPGGVSPICSDANTVVLLDEAVPAMGAVFCGGGTPTSTLSVAANEILRVAAHPLVAAIAEPPRD